MIYIYECVCVYEYIIEAQPTVAIPVPGHGGRDGLTAGGFFRDLGDFQKQRDLWMTKHGIVEILMDLNGIEWELSGMEWI